MFYRKINNQDLWKKIQKLRDMIKAESDFKERVCFQCNKSLNIFDFLSDNLEFTAGYILDLWQNDLYEFFCCDCFKSLKKQEMETIERELQYRPCQYCGKTIDIYEFSKLHNYLKIKELKEMWLNETNFIFCNKLCERKYFRDKRINT